MNYLMFIVSDGVMTDERWAAIQEIEGWANELDERGTRLLGRPLAMPDTAITVRVRDGETLISDGPFAESKEFIGGFDLLSCADLDEALDVAVHRPHCTVAAEVRPLRPGFELPERAREWGATVPPDSWVAFFCVDGIPEADEVEARIEAESREWGRRYTERGSLIFGHPLEHADVATTVRKDADQIVVTDGPFVETKEFVGGVAVLQGLDRDEVIAAVAEHPLAAFHRIEVRRFDDL
jgi:hypothetical protein